MATPNEPDLAESLRGYITAWVERVGPRIRDEMCVAAITIRLDQPQGEDDGTLYLDYTIDETITADRSGGRVTGQRFDPIPAPLPPRVVRCTSVGCGSTCDVRALPSSGWVEFQSGWVCSGCVPL